MAQQVSSVDSSDESSDEEEIQRDFEKEANLVIQKSTLPAKSLERYNLVYQTFEAWKKENKANSYDESILICYFVELGKKVAPTTLWSVWSILKRMLLMKHNVNIKNYLNLRSILKNNGKGYKPKKSLIFSYELILKFLNTADDGIYLCAKILLIFGICGALRCAEFINIKCSDVEDMNTKFLVTVRDTKTYIDRTFIIGPLYYSKVKEYISLRPSEMTSDRFFVQSLRGKCQRQVVGKNKVGSTPMVIATYLGLENPQRYTGHCYRRTSATLLSNSGANMAMIKELGGWSSDKIAGGYVAQSIRSKELIFQGITNDNNINSGASTSNGQTEEFISKNNNTNEKIKLVSDIHFTDNDFREEFVYPTTTTTTSSCQNLSSNFYSGRNQLLPPVLKNNNNIHSDKYVQRPFTKKPPVKLFFNGLTSGSASPVINDHNLVEQCTNKTPLEKKRRLSSSLTADAENLPSLVEREETSAFNSTIKCENCTINGNIINNYYYYRHENEK